MADLRALTDLADEVAREKRKAHREALARVERACQEAIAEVWKAHQEAHRGKEE